jgi:hypothetical protein
MEGLLSMDCRNPSATFLDPDHPREAILSIVRWMYSIIIRGSQRKVLRRELSCVMLDRSSERGIGLKEGVSQ